MPTSIIYSYFFNFPLESTFAYSKSPKPIMPT